MKNLIKLLSLVVVLSLTFMACEDKKECKEECKKECCEKKEAATEASANDSGEKKPCCKKKEEKDVCGPEYDKPCCNKEKKECKPGCEKPCCSEKENVDKIDSDSTSSEDNSVVEDSDH
jgi:hypothetical protein